MTSTIPSTLVHPLFNCILIATYTIIIQSITYGQTPLWCEGSDFPQNCQFYARTANNLATVRLSGTVFRSDITEIYAIAATNNQPFQHTRVLFPTRIILTPAIQGVPDSTRERHFDFQFPIAAEASTYSFTLGIKSCSWDSLIAVRGSIVCGDVILINGQSNVVLGSPVDPPDPFSRTFTDTSGTIVPLGYDSLIHNFVWSTPYEINSKGHPIGGIGFRLQHQIFSQQKIPVCLMNGGVGATSIQRHLPDSTFFDNPATIYGNLLRRVQRSGLLQAATTLVWYQGESNDDADQYLNKFRTLYTAWMRDYPNLQHVYVVQIHASNCLPYSHRLVKEQQRQLQDSFPRVQVVSTNGIPFHNGCHFVDSGYVILADKIWKLMARDKYHSADSTQLSSPNVENAYWTDSTRSQIYVTFRANGNFFSTTSDTILGGRCATMLDAFRIGEQDSIVKSVQAFGRDALLLTLTSPAPYLNVLSYANQSFYRNSEIVYQGPWVVNQRGNGILSFSDIPIQAQLPLQLPPASAPPPQVQSEPTEK